MTTQESGDARQRILQAAARLFVEKGYARTTTRAIANAAGVNEVTLFRHFGSKKELFSAVVDAYGGPALSSAMAEQLSGDYRQDLLFMGNLLMQTLIERWDALRFMMCEAGQFPEVRQILAENPRHLRRGLAAYLQMQMAQGRVRPLHAEAAALAFWNLFFAYMSSQWLLDEALDPPLSNEEIVAQFVDIFVAGTLATGDQQNK